MSDCIFCMIANGDIPARVVLDEGDIMAFDDIAPQGPVHTLIIPKHHYAHMGDDVPSGMMAALFSAVPRIAAMKGIAESGYRVIVNNGADAAQTVAHLHVHVIGGKPMAHGMVRFESGE
ncbi:MAG: HIT domain-containing protein [Actinobacteria bacterium]|nr:MAG: HIT domain-containing protein [Actinomycetota bacterium]